MQLFHPPTAPATPLTSARPDLVRLVPIGTGTGEPATPGAAFVQLGPVVWSAEEERELRWLVERGPLWSTAPALSRVDAARRLVDRVRSRFSEAVASDARSRSWLEDAPRIRVEVDAAADGLPWELFPLASGAPIGLAAEHVARCPGGSTAREAPPRDRLRVLLIIARPYGAADVPYLAVSRHFRRLLHDAQSRVDIEVLRPPTFAALASKLDGSKYDVLHFDGHGDVRPEGAVLTFEHANGGPDDVPADEIVDLLSAPSSPRLLVLNACRSGMTSAAPQGAVDAAPRMAASLAHRIALRASLPVVAMRYSVDCNIAGRFVGAFYDQLVTGASLGGAVQQGRRQLAVARTSRSTLDYSTGATPPRFDWLLPVLYATDADARIVTPSAAPTGRTEPGELSILHGLDSAFWALERAFATGHSVVLSGPIGSGKHRLAEAFLRWVTATSTETFRVIASTVTLGEPRERSSPRLTWAQADSPAEVAALITVSQVAGGTPAAAHPDLRESLDHVRRWTPRSIAVVHGSVPTSALAGGWVAIELGETDAAAAAQLTEELAGGAQPGFLERVLAASCGNLAFLETSLRSPPDALDEQLKRHPNVAFVRQIIDSCVARGEEPLLRAIAAFSGVINVFALRMLLRNRGIMSDPPESFLEPALDAASPERRLLERLADYGLLSRFGPNMYALSPWVEVAMGAREPESAEDRSHFTRAMAELSTSYFHEYHVRGLRDAAIAVGREHANLARAWTDAERARDGHSLVALFQAMSCWWTVRSRFDVIETRGAELQDLLASIGSSSEDQEHLLLARLQAASVVGRSEMLMKDVETALERHRNQWLAAGSPRGNYLAGGVDPLYLNVLFMRLNLAALWRHIGRLDAHRAACLELIEDFAAVNYAIGLVKCVKSLQYALHDASPPADADLVLELYRRHYDTLPQFDYVLRGEVLESISMLSVSRASRSDRSADELREAVRFMRAALSTLPPIASANRGSVLFHIAQCCALLPDRLDDAETAFNDALEVYATLDAQDVSALICAIAAQAFESHRRPRLASFYVQASEAYLAHAQATSQSRMARGILSKLNQSGG